VKPITREFPVLEKVRDPTGPATWYASQKPLCTLVPLSPGRGPHCHYVAPQSRLCGEFRLVRQTAVPSGSMAVPSGSMAVPSGSMARRARRRHSSSRASSLARGCQQHDRPHGAMQALSCPAYSTWSEV
jgi:hypothetical protein